MLIMLMISFTCSDLFRKIKICEDEMKWLDGYFKMAVSANQAISRLETKNTATRCWKQGISLETLDTVAPCGLRGRK